MNNKLVPTNQGTMTLQWTNDGRGIIDDAAITAFEWGHCHSFAYALNATTGWPIIGLGGYDGSPAHYACYDPKLDDFVDIQGPGAYERNKGYAHGYLVRYPPTVGPKNYRPMDKAMAKPFVRTMLDSIKDIPAKKRYTRSKWNKWFFEPMVLDKPTDLWYSEQTGEMK